MKAVVPLLVALVLPLLLAGPARGESPRALLKRGNQLFAAGEYDEARKVFEQAYRQNQGPVFLRSLAHALLKVRWHADALKRFREYLKQYPDAKDRAEVGQLVSQLDVVVHTQLTVRTRPGGASVFIDSEVGGRWGVTPYKGTIQPGTHVVILKKPGYRTVARSVTIRPRQEARLQTPLEVELKVTSVPPGATVHIDAPDAPSVGRTPLETGLPVGQHTIYVKRRGLEPYSEQVQVREARVVTVAAQLTRKVPVRSTPAGARVVVDGEALGRTPLDAPFTPGKHHIELRLKGLEPFVTDAEITVSSPANITGRLKGGALLSMRSEPAGAEVTLDDIGVGTTPLSGLPLPAGTHRLALHHPERRGWAASVRLRAGARHRGQVKLGRSAWPVWTLIAVAGVAGVVGTITGVAAMDRDDKLSNIVVEERDASGRPTGRLARGACTSDNQPVFDNMVDTTDGSLLTNPCGMGLHHTTTAMLTTAGTSAVGALLYYLFFVRSSGSVEAE